MNIVRSNITRWIVQLHKFRDSASIGCILCLAILTKSSISHGPLWGDDALLLRASRMPNGYASDFWLGFMQTGSAKYRPILSSVLALLTDKFGNDQFGYLVVSNMLLTVVAILVFVLSRRIGGSTLLSLAISSLVLVNRFSWYSQDNVFGIMEAGALIFLLLATLQVLRAVDGDYSHLRFAVSALFLLAATLIHERYLLVSAVIPTSLLIVVVVHRTASWIRAFRTSLIFLLIPAVHILLKAGLLNVSTLTGGGESNFSDVKGPWIAKHVLQTIASFAGLSEGNNYSADYWGIPSWIFALLTALVLLLVFLGIIAYCDQRLHLRRDLSSDSDGRIEFTLFLLLGILGSTSISASLVVERIEFRWVYAPFIFFLLLLILIYSEISNQLSGKILIMVIPILCMLELLYQPLHHVYTAPRIRVTEAINEAASSAPVYEPWKLQIGVRNWENWQWWQFAYGYVFTQLPNPPQSIDFFVPKPKYSGCVDIERISCLVLFIDGQSTNVSSFLVAKR